MTREEQDTERALVRSEEDWLKARGWQQAGAGHGWLLTRSRWAHPANDSKLTDYTLRDAVSLTRAEPLRFRKR